MGMISVNLHMAEILAKGYQNYTPLSAKSSSLPVKNMIRLLSSQSSLSQTEP